MYMHFVIVCQWEHVGHTEYSPCVVVVTWPLTNLDVLGRGPVPLHLSANGQLKKTVQNPFVLTLDGPQMIKTHTLLHTVYTQLVSQKHYCNTVNSAYQELIPVLYVIGVKIVVLHCVKMCHCNTK